MRKHPVISSMILAFLVLAVFAAAEAVTVTYTPWPGASRQGAMHRAAESLLASTNAVEAVSPPSPGISIPGEGQEAEHL